MNEKEIWEKYSPIYNPWFSSEITYEGWGKAFFEDPSGVVEGQTKVEVNELGNIKLEMKYERLDTEVEIKSNSEFYRILKFLHRTYKDSAFGNPDQVLIPIGTNNNHPCKKLSVQTNDGAFTVEGNIYWTAFGTNKYITFWVSRGTFIAENKSNPKYWVVPLINFTTTFRQNTHPLLTQHPLRQFSTPEISDIEDEKEKQIAWQSSNRRNFLIGFNFEEGVGFIEPLPDYTEREEKLKSEEEKKIVTSLMIGEVIDKMDTNWFPHQYTNLLSFAVGTEIGSSWLEIRDDTGKLIRREHFPSRKTSYEKNYAVINEPLYNGIGRLLSVASNSPEFNQTYFRVLISHLIDLMTYSRHFENMMTVLTRAIEGLSAKHGFGSQNLMDYLPEKYQQGVKEILTEAKNRVEKIMRQAQKENLIDASASLKRISNRIENANNKDGDFGLKVIELLKFYKLPDADIMEKYYSETNSQGRTWASFLSQMRNDPIHTGYFEIENGTYESGEIIRSYAVGERM